MSESKKSLVLQEWEESEAGWGVRPDGYSFHLNEEDCKAYVKEYWAKMPAEVQQEYSRECGKPVWVVISAAFYEEVKKTLDGNRKGHRVWHSHGRVVTSKTGERIWEEANKSKTVYR